MCYSVSMEKLDLEKIRAKWLNPCASCDAGMLMSCTCPTDDPRNIIYTLVNHLEDLYTNHDLLICSTMGEAFDRLEQTLSALAEVTAERDEARLNALTYLANQGNLNLQLERDLATARREAEQAQAELKRQRELLAWGAEQKIGRAHV